MPQRLSKKLISVTSDVSTTSFALLGLSLPSILGLSITTSPFSNTVTFIVTSFLIISPSVFV